MKKPRLAFVHDLPVGGAKRNFSSMLPGLAERFDITVFEFDRSDQSVFEIGAISSGHKRLFPAPSLESKRVLKIPLLGQILLDLYLLGYYRPIATEIHHGEFDAVMVTQSRITNTPPLLGIIKRPLIYACHEPSRVLYEPYHARFESAARKTLRKLHNSVNHWFARLRERYLISKAAVILANSYYSAEVFYRLFERPAVVAYPGVDGKTFNYAPTTRADFVLSVGSLDVIKGHDFVIECLSRISKPVRPRLVVVCPLGTHSAHERAHLVRLAQTLGVRIDIVCGISEDELSRLYATAIATLFCPRLEPFGLVSIEAMACGCPVLALAEGGLRETVRNGQTGFLLPRNPEAFAEKLTLLIEDDQERLRLGANGARHVRENFSWSQCADGALRAIDQAITRDQYGVDSCASHER